MPSDCLHVVIIGAGYAGLALARALRRAGVSCAVYEAQHSRIFNLDCYQLDDHVHFGKEFTSYDQQASGTVTALFADGTCAPGQLLVAADGARSAVRAQYRPARDLLPAWQTGNITLVGAALHPRADTALRDALLLSHALNAVKDGRVGLLNAVRSYEAVATHSGSPRGRRVAAPAPATHWTAPFRSNA